MALAAATPDHGLAKAIYRRDLVMGYREFAQMSLLLWKQLESGGPGGTGGGPFEFFVISAIETQMPPLTVTGSGL
jgi:hypothetical protein